jgi:hypothetical protein
MQWLIGQHFDCMSLEIVTKLPRTYDNYIANLFHIQIVFIGSCQDLRHKIYRELPLHDFVVFHDFFLDN